MNPQLLAIAATTTFATVALAQPAITQLPPTNQILVFPIDITDDGSAVLGYQDETFQWVWERSSGIITGLTNLRAAAFNANGTTIAGEQLTPWNNSNRFTPTTIDWPSLSVMQADPVTGWRGCDDDVANVQDISGNGRFIAALVWGDPSCPNPLSSGACCITTAAIYDTANLSWQLLPKTSASVSAKASRLSRSGAVAVGWNDNSSRRASVWINGVQNLLSLGGSPSVGEAFAVSDNGRYAVGTRTPVGLRNTWRWDTTTPVNAVTDLGTVPASINPGNSVVPAAISNNGRTVVGFRGFGIDRDAWIWRQGAGYTKLFDHLQSIGLVTGEQPWTRITIAATMSPDGRYIGAQGADFGGTFYPLIIDLGPQACNEADVGGQGGTPAPDYALDNNDFVVFIDKFFLGDPAADLGSQGGIPGADTQFDNNDFIVFIDYFFAGC